MSLLNTSKVLKQINLKRVNSGLSNDKLVLL